MKKTWLTLFCLCICHFSKGQTDTVEILFQEFYEIRVGHGNQQYYSILYDSTIFPEENLTFMRVLKLSDKINEGALSPGSKYKLVIDKKSEHQLGCEGQLLHIRSNRGQTDPGTLFGSDFLGILKEEIKKNPCNYKAIEYYYIEAILEDEN